MRFRSTKGFFLILNQPDSQFERNNYEILIRMPHSFLNRSINIIMDQWNHRLSSICVYM